VTFITKLKAVGECLACQDCGVMVWVVGDSDVCGLYDGDRVGWPAWCPWTRGASRMGGEMHRPTFLRSPRGTRGASTSVQGPLRRRRVFEARRAALWSARVPKTV
jgi:hypothetical protein